MLGLQGAQLALNSPATIESPSRYLWQILRDRRPETYGGLAEPRPSCSFEDRLVSVLNHPSAERRMIAVRVIGRRRSSAPAGDCSRSGPSQIRISPAALETLVALERGGSPRAHRAAGALRCRVARTVVGRRRRTSSARARPARVHSQTTAMKPA